MYVTARTARGMASFNHPGGFMSAALAEPVVLTSKPAVARPELVPAADVAPSIHTDQHPLLPVFVIGGLALFGALAFVGSILIWLWLHNSGVMAQ
jgi:hypothetical protein